MSFNISSYKCKFMNFLMLDIIHCEYILWWFFHSICWSIRRLTWQYSYLVYENNPKLTNQSVRKVNRIHGVIKHSFWNLDPHIIFISVWLDPHLDYAIALYVISICWRILRLGVTVCAEAYHQIGANAQREIRFLLSIATNLVVWLCNELHAPQ